MYVTLTLGDIQLKVLVDTGANVTLIPGRVYDQISPEKRPKLEPVQCHIRLADGHHLPARGKSSLPLSIGGATLTHAVWVAEIEGMAYWDLTF